jgi:transposase
MTLNEEQKKLVAAWVAEGASLSEVQRRLKEECEITATYMDVRFLVDDLQLQLKEQPKQSEAVDRLAAAKQEGETARTGPPPGGVSVTMDTITKPQALVSGKVTFSDGETAEWMLDQTGRLGLNPAKPGYRPSQSDVMTFQEELQRVVQGLG